MTDNNPLFDEPKLDEFKTESPLRAFASFDMFGNYLIAKGFRPSLGHLTRYLDAMEKKEGWQFVQLLEAATGVPTIIFRRSKGDLLQHFTGSELLVEMLREQLQKGHTHIQTWSIHTAHPDSPGYIGEETVEVEVASYEPFTADMRLRHPFAAPFGEDTLTIRGLDPERVLWNRVQWDGNPESLMNDLRNLPYRDMNNWLERENVTCVSHFYRTASVASVLRLIDKFDAWDKVSLGEYISDDALYTAIGRVNVKARAACTTDVYTAFANAIRESEVTSDDEELATYQPPINPVDVLEKAAEDLADDLGLEVDRESFAVAREHLEEMVPLDMDDDLPFNSRGGDSKTVDHVVYQSGEKIVHEVNISSAPKFNDANPEHYNGWACGDIGERLSANGYQILKYCWRLGKKDDPCKELGKALRYLERERDLMSQKGHPNHRSANWCGLISPDNFFNKRVADQSIFTTRVAFFLWHGYNVGDLDKLQAIIADHKAHLDCGHGLAI